LTAYLLKNKLLLQNSSTIILGIDPGTVVMGYGIIEITNTGMQVVELNVLKLQKKKDAYERLQLIHQTVCDLIAKYHPQSFAIEAPFFGKNVQSMLKLGRAQGVAIAAAMNAGLPVTEYSPKKVKQSVTGNGNADKEQVRKMLCHILNKEISSKYYDATDALAVAVCHHFNSKIPVMGSKKPGVKSQKKNSWEEFIRRNPQRIHPG
jgi:crossover junction endodeoxyribonuclease RuvC